jgi:FtsZ-binding cell division protein ZapB
LTDDSTMAITADSLVASGAGGDIEMGRGGEGTQSPIIVNLPPEPELKGPLKPVAEITAKEMLAAIVAGATVILAIAAMVVEGGAIVTIAGILSIIMGPYAYYQQTKLTDIATLKETTAAIQVEVDRFKEQNVRLAGNVNELAATIEELQDVEQALDIISNTQGQSVEAFETQVQENQAILARMKKSTKGRVIQNLISIIYRGDSDSNNIISEKEAKQVISELQEVGGLMIHEDRLRAAIVGKKVECIVDVVQNFLGDDIAEEERIIELVPQ